MTQPAWPWFNNHLWKIVVAENDPSKAVQYFSPDDEMYHLEHQWRQSQPEKSSQRRDWCLSRPQSGPKVHHDCLKTIRKKHGKSNSFCQYHPKTAQCTVRHFRSNFKVDWIKTETSNRWSLLITCDRFLEQREPLCYRITPYKSCKIVQIQRHTKTNWVSVLRTRATFLANASESEPTNG